MLVSLTGLFQARLLNLVLQLESKKWEDIVLNFDIIGSVASL